MTLASRKPLWSRLHRYTMTPASLKNLQSLLADMLLPASKHVVHHGSMLCFCLQLLAYMLSVSHRQQSWAARYDTGLLIKLTPKGVVFSFLFVRRQHCQYTVYCVFGPNCGVTLACDVTVGLLSVASPPAGHSGALPHPLEGQLGPGSP